MPNNFEINDGTVFDDLLEGDSGAFTDNDSQQESESTNIPDNTDLVDISGQELSEDSQQEPNKSETQESGDTDDFLMSFLSEYGLKDGKVTYENENGETEEIDFNDLDSQEKINILKELTSPNLTKDEIETINYLRSNNATIQDVIKYYSQKAVEDYIKENGPTEKQYSVDEYSDDELYIADLKSKFSDMTDEERMTDLEIAKENQDLFKKKVEIIRKQYKANEEEQAKERVKAQEEQYNAFKTSLETQLTGFNEISMDYKDDKSDRLQIEDSEKEEIYKYILNQDENGSTQFFKDLNDPKMLVEMAWFALYGKDAISDITNYWKSQLKNTRQKQETKSQTIVKPADKKQVKDIFANHQRSVETTFGDDLL